MNVDLPARQDIVIARGCDFSVQVTCLQVDNSPVNITGATARARLADAPGGSVLLTFTCTIPTGTDGVIKLSATALQTAALTFFSGWYSVEVTLSGGPTLPVIEGQATLDYRAGV